jgi:hypothetical protein
MTITAICARRRRILVLGVLTMFVSVCSPVLSQTVGGYVTVYGTTGGSHDGCTVWEPEGGGVLTVYVIHEWWSCIDEVGFRLTSGGGFAGTYLGETIHDAGALGNTQDGILIISVVASAPTLLATVQYTTDGTSPACSWLEVVAHPETGCMWVVDCGGYTHTITTAGKLSVNVVSDPEVCSHVWCWLPIGTEESTWGQIKALYG